MTIVGVRTREAVPETVITVAFDAAAEAKCPPAAPRPAGTDALSRGPNRRRTASSSPAGGSPPAFSFLPAAIPAHRKSPRSFSKADLMAGEDTGDDRQGYQNIKRFCQHRQKRLLSLLSARKPTGQSIESIGNHQHLKIRVETFLLSIRPAALRLIRGPGFFVFHQAEHTNRISQPRFPDRMPYDPETGADRRCVFPPRLSAAPADYFLKVWLAICPVGSSRIRSLDFPARSR